ncbi:Peptidyl-prolyl cis-trans isomerase PpiD [Labilithrix luteola]|uniref:Peptidyl-prolyl cis-trans isomerase PpiD n=1 Tax=Labilithrix luteola TaxID=1391654 RepID=A0A0K1PUH4_9BACT|nr:peptidyl-prolyl cis-trans isomerase [Labilithrix luteola]AKU97185.1 Peptidyl-prolyl cis-trans isomerase PpiD [Labilithrix luteola]
MQRTMGALLAAFSVMSCGQKATTTKNELASLGGDVAARVGAETIPVSLVAKVAAEQRVTPREALHRLLDDAIAANAARERGLDRSTPPSWRLTASRARLTADKLLAEAKLAGPPTDEEVAALSLDYWREVDRPVAVRTIHVLVKRPKELTPALEAQDRAFAETLRAEVLTATDEAEFKAKAEAAPHPPGVEIVVERLPPFTATGAVTEGPGQMVLPFAQGAHAIANPGETSGIVETTFGWHIIRLIERLPEERMPMESRRVAFTDAAYARRAKRALDERLAALKKANSSHILPTAEQLTRELFSVETPAPQ